MKEYHRLSHTRWDCNYHVVFIPKRCVGIWKYVVLEMSACPLDSYSFVAIQCCHRHLWLEARSVILPFIFRSFS